MDLVESILEEAERVRRSLRLLQEYDYETAALDVLRTCELASDELLYATDDPWKVIGIAQVGKQSFARLLDWLPSRNANWTYRPSADVIDERRLHACRDAFQFAFDLETLRSAERLYREGFFSCTLDGNRVTFSPTSLRLSFLRGVVDNVVSDRERAEWPVPAKDIRILQEARELAHDVAKARARDLLDELDLIPEAILIDGYTMGQFKTVWQALTVDAIMWRARPQRNPLIVPQKTQLREAVKVMRVKEFVRELAHATGQNRKVVRAVMEDLVFRKEVGLSLDVWTNPLILLGTDHIALAPRLFMGNRIGRNFPKMWLKRHPRRYHLTTGSRIVENAYVDKIRKLVEPLADPDLIIINKRLPAVPGEVDLAFVDAAHETLLIVEAKCIIAPDSLREQRKARDESLKGVSQVQHIIDWVRANLAAALEILFGKTKSVPHVKKISGLVVCNWSYGSEDPVDIPVVSHYAISQRMHATTPPQTAAGLLGSLSSIRIINPDIEELQYSEYDFTIGTFHIRTPVTHYLANPME